jgi:hypothetical protein
LNAGVQRWLSVLTGLIVASVLGCGVEPRARSETRALPAGGVREQKRLPVDIPTSAEHTCAVTPSLGERLQGCGRVTGGEVSFFPRAGAKPVSAPADFTRGDPEELTLVVLPDTQYYSEKYPQTFLEQTRFVVENREALGIAGVVALGDLVQNAHIPDEWVNAHQALTLLELSGDQKQGGIPYGIVVGNHDQHPMAHALGTVAFNEWFGAGRFRGRPYYGGHFGADNDNSYFTFGRAQQQFLVLLLEYDELQQGAIFDWARGVMRAHPSHRVIVGAHYLIDAEARWGEQGRRVYEALREEPNLTLMLCGHMVTEARRSDPKVNGSVHTLLSDYQSRRDGGEGWLRLLRFFPNQGRVSVFTYSPSLMAWEIDESSRFDLEL